MIGMADRPEMVTVNGVRYRPEDAPKRRGEESTATAEDKPADHKMRRPRTSAKK